MRTRTCALVVVPIVLALAGCGSSDADPGTEPPDTSDASDEEDPAAAEAASDDAASDAGSGDEGEQATADDGERGDCPDGPRELDGVSVMTFLCGSATASVITAGGTSSLSGGTCEAREDTFAVSFGTVVLDVQAVVDGTAPDLDYVGIAVHEGAVGDGTYDDVDMVTVVATLGGEDLDAGTGTVTLRDARTAGEAVTDVMTVEFDCG